MMRKMICTKRTPWTDAVTGLTSAGPRFGECVTVTKTVRESGMLFYHLAEYAGPDENGSVPSFLWKDFVRPGQDVTRDLASDALDAIVHEEPTSESGDDVGGKSLLVLAWGRQFILERSNVCEAMLVGSWLSGSKLRMS